MRNNIRFNVISKMLSELSDRRYGIYSNTKYDDVEKKYLNEIDNIIYQKISLAYNKLTTKEEFYTYENSLAEYMTSISQNSIRSDISDYDRIFKNSIDISTSMLNIKDITIGENIKEYIKESGLTTTGLNGFFSNPDYARKLTIENVDFLFTTKKIDTIRGKKLIFSLICSEVGNDESYIVDQILVFNYIKMSNMIKSPLKLFFYIINNYGLDITLENVTKKIFYNVKKTYSVVYFEDMMKNDKRYESVHLMSSKSSDYWILLYAIDRRKYLNEYHRYLV